MQWLQQHSKTRCFKRQKNNNKALKSTKHSSIMLQEIFLSQGWTSALNFQLFNKISKLSKNCKNLIKKFLNFVSLQNFFHTLGSLTQFYLHTYSLSTRTRSTSVSSCNIVERFSVVVKTTSSENFKDSRSADVYEKVFSSWKKYFSSFLWKVLQKSQFIDDFMR